MNATTGAVLERSEYDEWGLATPTAAASVSWQRFAGGMRDPDTGLVRYGFSDYDPEVGRWTSKDPIGFASEVTGLYTYLGNDPVNRVDRLGLYFTPSSILAGQCLDALAGNPMLGPFIGEMVTSEIPITITMGSGVGGDHFANAGYSLVTPTEGFTVQIDSFRAENAMICCGYPEGANPISLVAHELGHVYGKMWGEIETEEIALAWENTTHLNAPREEHDCQNYGCKKSIGGLCTTPTSCGGD